MVAGYVRWILLRSVECREGGRGVCHSHMSCVVFAYFACFWHLIARIFGSTSVCFPLCPLPLPSPSPLHLLCRNFQLKFMNRRLNERQPSCDFCHPLPPFPRACINYGNAQAGRGAGQRLGQGCGIKYLLLLLCIVKCINI